MTTITPDQPRLTSQTWAGHWHGFGPWLGSTEVYFKEGNRRPAHAIQPDPTATHADRYREAGSEFATGALPPLMTGHWLLKRGQAARDRTWTDVGEATEWLELRYVSSPPFERTDGLQAYADLTAKTQYALNVLPRGVDVCWVHYTQSRALFAVQVVCCPNLHHLDLACPLPPS
ncbi:hypothetical protein ABZY14_16000 [Streptomyces sp. NPDC006617]|uniref:hypothetical protein n=1 Tax=Streptomyces sp. NPDC006617 TaxID=3155354 RepID=UPI0033A5F0C1